VTGSAKFAKTKPCDCDLAAIVVSMRWTAERRTPQQARDEKIDELAWYLGWQSLRGRGGRRATLGRFVAVEIGPPPKPGDVVFLNILHMTAAWHRHVSGFASVEDWMTHAANQPEDLQDKPPETRARVRRAVQWILAHPEAAPYRAGGKVHRANTRDVLALLWGFNSGESLRRALATDRQHRTVATWVNFRGLFAALHDKPENPDRWTARDRAAFQGWARWTFPGVADL
jgi:hypothetical protein